MSCANCRESFGNSLLSCLSGSYSIIFGTRIEYRKCSTLYVGIQYGSNNKNYIEESVKLKEIYTLEGFLQRNIWERRARTKTTAPISLLIVQVWKFVWELWKHRNEKKYRTTIKEPQQNNRDALEPRINNVDRMQYSCMTHYAHKNMFIIEKT